MSVYRMTPEQVRAHKARLAKAKLAGAPAPAIVAVPYGMTGEGPSPAFQEAFGKARAAVDSYMNRGRMPKSFRLFLPWPPSVNHNTHPVLGGGRILTEQHKAFRSRVAVAVYKQKIATLSGRLRVSIEACPPDNRARDLDNIIKPILDALQRAGAIINDRDVEDIHIVRTSIGIAGTIGVEVSEL